MARQTLQAAARTLVSASVHETIVTYQRWRARVGLTWEVMVIDRFEEQLRSAFPAGAITRVQVLESGDDPEIEPEQTAMRVFFEWPGRTEGKKADPKTVHAFVYGYGAAITKLGDELPTFIGWVELRPEGLGGTSRDDGLAFRIGGRRGLA